MNIYTFQPSRSRTQCGVTYVSIHFYFGRSAGSNGASKPMSAVSNARITAWLFNYIAEGRHSMGAPFDDCCQAGVLLIPWIAR